MSETTLLVIGIILLICGTIIGYLIGLFKSSAVKNKLKENNTKLEALLEAERLQKDRELEANKLQKQQLSETFQALSSQVLKQNSESFLQLAKENLTQFHIKAQGEMEKKEQAIDALVKPIKETLDKTQQQINLMEKERKEAYGSLSKHLEGMAETQKNLHAETRNLVQAFRRPEVRGQWGELTLKRLAELAGMVEHCDFQEQASVSTDEGATLRPDMIVKMPGGREIIVDSKTPLDAYLDAIEAQTESEKEIALERHVRHVKQRVKELASKAYWQQFKQSPDFVVLFIPGDQFLNAALDKDRNLIEDALKNKVIISTPTSFVALLRAVAYGWRQEVLAENAERIKHLGEEMYSRMATFSATLGKVGKSLEQSVGHYNNAVASFTSRILPTTRKFQEMGVETKKEITDIEPVEKAARLVESDSTDK